MNNDTWMLVIDQIDYPKHLVNLSQTCKLLYGLCGLKKITIKKYYKDDYNFDTKYIKCLYKIDLKGNIHGKKFVYYAFSQPPKIIREEIYKEGKLHGTCKVWNQEGQLISECLYINNVRLRYKVFHEKTQGRLKKLIIYKRNAKHIEIHWNSDGKFLYKKIYKLRWVKK